MLEHLNSGFVFVGIWVVCYYLLLASVLMLTFLLGISGGVKLAINGMLLPFKKFKVFSILFAISVIVCTILYMTGTLK